MITALASECGDLPAATAARDGGPRDANEGDTQ
jgi:hypothetical protein